MIVALGDAPTTSKVLDEDVDELRLVHVNNQHAAVTCPYTPQLGERLLILARVAVRVKLAPGALASGVPKAPQPPRYPRRLICSRNRRGRHRRGRHENVTTPEVAADPTVILSAARNERNVR